RSGSGITHGTPISRVATGQSYGLWMLRRKQQRAFPDAINGPLRRLADKRLLVLQGVLQRRQRRSIAAIAQDDGRVSQQAAPLGPHERGVTKTLAKRLFG